jgi:hypothetical protein
MPYNFLVVSWAAPGDLGPMLSGARQLRDRGHDVSLHCAFGRTRTGGGGGIQVRYLAANAKLFSRWKTRRMAIHDTFTIIFCLDPPAPCRR